MRLKEALEQMEENLIRYKHEAETGTRYGSAKIMTEAQIERRKRSTGELEKRIELVEKWTIHKQRPDQFWNEFERETIAMYDLDMAEITTGMLP